MSELLRQIPVSSCFSTATRSKSKPYLLLGTEFKKDCLNFNLYDPTRNQEVVKNLKIQHQNQTLRNLFKEEYLKIGYSRGYLALRNKKDSVYLVDIFNQATPNVISLPPLNIDNRDTHVNVSVSVSSPVNSDIIVAVKFLGSRLSLCRVGDSEWTRIDVRCPCFRTSPVMYSERDERFYLNNCNRYPDPIDLAPKSGLVIPVNAYLKFPISNKAEFEKNFPSLTNFPIIKEDSPSLTKFPIIKEDLKSSSYFPITLITSFEKDSTDFKIEQQLVQSSSGQSFIVYRFIDCLNKKGQIVDLDDEVTKEIVVFKQDEEKEIGLYTNDIGDLCIFMGKNEAFCVSASDYPGLKPNSVYFTGHGSDVGVYDLFSRTILRFPHNLTPQPHGPMLWILLSPTLPSSSN